MVKRKSKKASAEKVNKLKMNLLSIVLVMAMVALALSADYLLKLAGQKKFFWNVEFFGGMILYALTAFIWLFVLKILKFSIANLIYSTFTVLLAVLIGVTHFKESLNVLEILAIGMALSSIFILARFS